LIHFLTAGPYIGPQPGHLDVGGSGALNIGGSGALKPAFHCVRTPWIRGFMAFQLARRARIVMLMVPV
jgi:hypothetical protein